MVNVLRKWILNVGSLKEFELRNQCQKYQILFLTNIFKYDVKENIWALCKINISCRVWGLNKYCTQILSKLHRSYLCKMFSITLLHCVILFLQQNIIFFIEFEKKTIGKYKII